MMNGKEDAVEEAKRRIRRNAQLTPRIRLETKEEIINWWNEYDK